MSIDSLRRAYHREICRDILTLRHGRPNIADVGSKASKAIAAALVERLPYAATASGKQGQSVGKQFEVITARFLERAFGLLQHLRPGNWVFSVSRGIAHFEQYEHLAELQRVMTEHPDIRSALGGAYLVTPDIVIGRQPVSDLELNRRQTVVKAEPGVCRHSPLRQENRDGPKPILHASISCKWTMRSDRAQNIRTEGLNLIRNRKGHTPHIAAVTAEPLPSRLASLALGTGDLDCVYCFALPELVAAVKEHGGEDQCELLDSMIRGRRLRDISDLPLDLAI